MPDLVPSEIDSPIPTSGISGSELMSARFGDQSEIAVNLRRYAELLGSVGVERGLIGPREIDRLWERHLLNCAAVVDGSSSPIPVGATVVDIGSGAGLPGLVWAIIRSDLSVTLLEPLLRRSNFLLEAVAMLGLSQRVSVVRARSEEIPALGADVVTARAVAPLPRLLEWTMPHVRIGGSLVALKGASVAAELAAVTPELGRFGVGKPLVEKFNFASLEPAATVLILPRVALGHMHPLGKTSARGGSSRQK